MTALGDFGKVCVCLGSGFESAMTAIAIVPATEGFSIAADGKLGFDDESRRTASPQELAMETKKQQKIFQAPFPAAALAYAITGSVRDWRGFDLPQIIDAQIYAIQNQKFDDFYSCLRVLGGKINRAINDARSHGALEAFPQINKMEQSHAWIIARIYFCGYFDHLPCFSQIDFFHFPEGNSQFKVNEKSLVQPFVIGSDIVWRRMYGNPPDPLFADFVHRLDTPPSLEDAKRFAQGYVKACSSALGLEVDEPFCKMIGGHLHMATITKSDGFSWAIKPAV